MPLWRRCGDDRVGVVRHAHLDRVEERVVHEFEPAAAQPLGQDRGEAVHPVRDRLESLATVVDGVHRGHHGEQHLRGADVGGRLLATDVLLARLQGEAQRGRAVGVDRDADEAAGQLALEARAHAHEGGVGAAVGGRDAEAL